MERGRQELFKKVTSKTSFSMGSVVFVFICFILGIVAEVKDNETLIYYWDVHHRINYYCQFGTNEELSQQTSIERQCFNRNKGMQHILSSGVKTFPYLSYSSSVGFILHCKDIPNGNLHDCNRYIYTSCNYTCNGSSVIKEIRCELKGPKENVTAQWSVLEPCPGPSQMKPSPQITSELPLGDELVTNSSIIHMSETANTTAPTLMASQSDNKSIIILCAVLAIFILIVVVFGFVMLRKRLQKKKSVLCCWSKTTHTKSQDKEVHYENIDLIFLEPTLEQNRLLEPPIVPIGPTPEQNHVHVSPIVPAPALSSTVTENSAPHTDSNTGSHIGRSTFSSMGRNTSSHAELEDERITKVLSDIGALPAHVHNIKVHPADTDDYKILQAFDDIDSMCSGLNFWDAEKQMLEAES